MRFSFATRGSTPSTSSPTALPNAGPALTGTNNLNEQQKTDLLTREVRRILKNDWNRPRANQPRVRINTIGFFFESPEVGSFLWALARENDGSFVGMSRP